ncbi:hypothetical protein F2Q69_00009905 [Brassica cretica]|uniref:Uncharacterized protein n=1 Tax=Brassica cretica TaxID=69181 RepID=A0A8S9NYX6_BRACR|nr:hypothetical protein F2Q69_00009905 [Brassica cretica]
MVHITIFSLAFVSRKSLASLMAEIRHIGSLSPEEAHAFRSDGCFTWWEELVSSSLSHVWVLGLVNLNAFLVCSMFGLYV